MFQKNDTDLTGGVARQKPDTVETVVGPSVVVEGDFSSAGNILVKGTVCGNVKTGELLTVEEGAKILANVKARNAVISGEVKGNVRVEDRLELHQSSKIRGDIGCKTLVVAAGALIHGKVVMKGADVHDDRVKDVKKKPAAKAKIKAKASPDA